MGKDSKENLKGKIDKAKIEEAVKLFLEGIGEDINREGLIETPKRISNMCEEVFAGLYDDPAKYLSKTFRASSNEMVIEKDITFYSVCEHHIVPFYGKAHIGYIPNGKVVGLSKLARTVEVYAKRPQIQEQMTAQIADAIMTELDAKGVIVMVEAEHMCMTMRGIKKPGTKTVTYVTRGEFEENIDLQNKFMMLVK
jgi:GTP cyclohydrolase I